MAAQVVRHAQEGHDDDRDHYGADDGKILDDELFEDRVHGGTPVRFSMESLWSASIKF
jgi:hypothetical protein